MGMAYTETQDGKVHINPGMGKYDVFVVAGPSYTTRRQESAEAIAQLVNGNPQILALLGDEWVKMMDWPNADKLSQRFKALLPPEVKAAEQPEGEAPEVAQVKQEAEQMMQQMAQALEEAQAQMREMQAKLDKAEEDNEAKEKEILIKGYQAETERLKALQGQMDPNQVAMLAAQLVMQTLQTPDPAPMELEESSPEEADLPQPYGMETQDE